MKQEIVSPLRDIHRFPGNFMFRFAEIFVLTASSCLKRDENKNPHFAAQKNTCPDQDLWRVWLSCSFFPIFFQVIVKKIINFFTRGTSRFSRCECLVEIDFYEKLYRNHRNGKQEIYR